MQNTIKRYNEALVFIQEEKYEAAAHYLEIVLKKFPTHSLSRWTLGLLHVLTGYPHRALSQWTSITDNEIEGVEEKSREIEKLLPEYDSIYDCYNRVISHIRDEQFELALQEMKGELLQKDLPLPTSCYEAYLLLLLLNEQVDEAEQVYHSLAAYQKQCSSIQRIHVVIEEIRNSQGSQRTVNIKRLLYTSGLVASLLVGALAMKALAPKEMIEVAAEPLLVVAPQTEVYEEMLADLDKQVHQLEETQAELETELQLVQEFKQEVEDVISVTEINWDDLVFQAAKISYENGMNAFKSGEYELASQAFEESIQMNVSYYFSDDAFFFLLQSKLRINNEDPSIEPLIDRFLQSDTRQLQESPYVDDVLLLKAQLLLNAGQKTEGIALLEKITSDYTDDWTGQHAYALLRDIIGGSYERN
ncbi:tetratricopeptide repeat protein [Bacillus alkalicellulosilyticus]|uniref:tetratricopeptide repeat protein n=1 Tax=Alkalihalobacterium alkalicellulosilyticum TaxID=1912214 RepID=UPI0009979111|nr:tetratricopeptide repeat protein [Bacillus alkalicellulosilyticus]